MEKDFLTMSIGEFTEALASSASVPGGGGASAFVAGLSVALGRMVAALTTGKKKYADTQEELEVIIEQLVEFQKVMLDSVEKDAEVFYPLSQAYSLPKETEEEKAFRAEMLERLLADAAGAPLELMGNIVRLMGLLEHLSAIGSRMVISDAGVAVCFAKAALDSSALNVYINTKLMRNKTMAESMNKIADEFKEEGRLIEERVSGHIIDELKTR
ncbi:MAG: cyclodeaminase/cyclohydrolase family protein [Clostridiales bacterium]|nr:cyclodeaminase/cyclohydrolase family protein [Clostridiales bacterium]